MKEAWNPTTSGERITVLDTLRGIAIVGILPANLPHFTLPSLAAKEVHFMSGLWSEGLAVGLLQTFIDLKFLTIFALLFGAGMALQQHRAAVRGRPFPSFYAWRMGLLIVIGLGHAWLIWFGDILFWYALTGLVALFFIRCETRTLWILGVILVVISGLGWLLIGLLTSVLGGVFKPPGPESWTVAEVFVDRGLLIQSGLFEFHPFWETVRYADGSYVEALAMRFVNWLMLATFFVLIYLWRVLGLFLLGMALMRSGILQEPGKHRRLLAWLIGLGLALGLPLEALRGGILAFGSASDAMHCYLEALHQLSSLTVSLAYIALVLKLPASWSRGPLLYFVAIGRMALSTYLLESVIAASVFYSFGLGLYGSMTRVQIWLLAVVIGAALGPISATWLRFFHFGPVEWAWRSLAYWRVQPLRKAR